MSDPRFEPFFVLKEFQSLDRLTDEAKLVIHAQSLRLKKIKQMQESRQSDLALQEAELKTLNQKLESKEDHNLKLSKNFEQTLQAETNITTNTELDRHSKQKISLKAEKDQLDLEIITLMEEQEKLETLIHDDLQFLQGVAKTYTEIEAEVNELTQVEQDKIKDFEMRQKLLLESLPPHFQSKFKLINGNLKGKRPITVAKGSNCAECSFVLPRNLLSELDHGASLVTCPSCSRLLLPSTAS